MGGDHAPKSEVEGAIRACQASDVRVILVGLEDVIRGNWPRTQAAGLPIESSTPRNSSPWKTRRRRRSAPRRILPSAWRAVWSRRRGAGRSLGGQHRRGHGDREDGVRHDSRRGSSGAGVGVSYREGIARGGGGCGRERRFNAGDAGAVRRDGRNLFAHHFPQPQSRASVCSRSAKRNTRVTISPAPRPR